ncbi:uncharacterized protein Dwil_GK27075 [Drosophila willistoni]|uniref:Peptidase S1 domain-containing protein n=1 Tax=Drosophila willistoni TaxID=7260 RepID=A0A0Q9WNJ0_DROWI|nr:vitellin-degrading protease [Drosophila willistoni]KRF97482.1 uncharacterized protein Dwil_GK27075 [Drosophila willistoni]
MLSVKSLIPVLGLLLTLSGNVSFFADAIIGSHFAVDGQFPYQIALIYDGKQKCGGSVVTKHMILTAAHCVTGSHLKLLKIIVGNIFWKSVNAQIFDVQEIIVHPNFSFDTKDYDIALVRLNKPLIFDKNVRPIRLAPAGQNYKENLTTIVSGFGDINARKDRLSDLKYALIQLWGRRYCNSANIPELTDRMICAGDPLGRQGPCEGDSGGPLTLHGHQIGIVSWGYGCGRAYRPSIFTYVPYLRQWIDANIHD